MIHKYIRHGEMAAKRQFVFGIFYFLAVNAFVLAISYVRGIKGLHFTGMTMSYRFKYIGAGAVLGLVLPFPVCLMTEDKITIGGLKRYGRRFAGDLKKYFAYAVRAARADLRAEVANAYLDWLWWLIEPICTMLIYTLIFGVVFRVSEQYFPIFIFIGITVWEFFSRNVASSVNIVRMNKGIVTKIYMPKYILLLSRMFVNGFKMFVSFVVVAIMMVLFKVPVTINILFLLPVLIVLFMFTFGVGTIMMHYGVYVSDLSYITGIVLNMLMYFTGIFYSISGGIPEPFGSTLEKYNPVAFLISTVRNILLYKTAPSWGHLCLWAFISMILIALGVFTVYSNENSYVKVI